MNAEPRLAAAAQLFKTLGSEPRLALLHTIEREPRSVSALAEATGMSQPLVSQHLRTLRLAGLVTPVRAGKLVTYELADQHVSHVIADALEHVQEPVAGDPARTNHPAAEQKETA
ncbi:ArsR/SmtB family transcription factor [Microbacterium karelineae]|uniref:ArsR/SmtB family transcription factor n=1 Tax=Microbacterium karelineae TaxID=2654283 RepID=UPI0012E9E168|nr:metalloregulator ArsR/SmtB family transcription factor [Microbacterium karelineae]